MDGSYTHMYVDHYCINEGHASDQSIIPRTGVFVVLGDLWDKETQTWTLTGSHIVRQQDFWFIMGMTLL